MIEWQIKPFEHLTISELYDILKLRQDVFVIEQECIYPDIDQADKDATHLFAYSPNRGGVCAYLRMFAPGLKNKEVSIGRVVTSEASRGLGLGKKMMFQALNIIEGKYPSDGIKISAQVYLVDFYREFGFEVDSDAYDEDGIPHIEMLKPVARPQR